MTDGDMSYEEYLRVTREQAERDRARFTSTDYEGPSAAQGDPVISFPPPPVTWVVAHAGCHYAIHADGRVQQHMPPGQSQWGDE